MARSSIIALVLLMGACDFSPANRALNAVDLLIGVDSLATTMVVSVIDAETGEPIEAPKHIVLTTGDVSGVVDGLGRPVDRFQTESPHVAFGFDQLFNPTDNRPLAMQVAVSAPGWLPGGARLIIDHPGHHALEVRLLPGTRPIDGVLSARAGGGSASNGRIQQGLVLEAGPGSGSSGFVSLSIPDGIYARSYAGKPAEGALTATARYVSGVGGYVDDAFPGGARTRVAENNQIAYPQNITSGALAAFSLFDEAGEPMGRFSWLIEWTASVDPNLFHPYIKRTIREGDAIGVFAFDPSTASWRRDGSTTLKLIKGKLGVRVQTDKLTTWAVGYTTAPCQPGRVDFENNTKGGEIRLATSGTGHGVITIPFDAGDTYARIPRPPAGWVGVATVYHGDEILEIPYSNLCGQVLTARFAPAGDVRTGTALVTLEPCPALQVTNYSTWTLLYRRVNAGGVVERLSDGRAPAYRRADKFVPARDEAGRVTGATATLPGLVSGAYYEFAHVVGRHSLRQIVRADSALVELTAGDLLLARNLCSRR